MSKRALFLIAPLLLPFALAEEPKVYSVRDDGVSPPTIISKVEPKYTEAAREAGIQGRVVLRLQINEEGQTGNIQVEENLDSGLDEQAVIALRQWKFQPAAKDGRPVRVAATVEINFRLK